MAKARARPPLKGPERGAEPSIRVAIGMALAIFLPQQGQRHALALQLGRDIRPVRLHRITPRSPLAPKQRCFQHIIVGISLRQRPYRKLRLAGPIQIRRYRRLADPKPIRDLADRQTLRTAQAENRSNIFTVTSLVRFRFGILISSKSLSMSRQNSAPDKNRYKTSSRCPRFNEIYCPAFTEITVRYSVKPTRGSDRHGQGRSTLHDGSCRTPCKTRFQLAGCAFPGQESNPLGSVERFQINSSSSPGLRLALRQYSAPTGGGGGGGGILPRRSTLRRREHP